MQEMAELVDKKVEHQESAIFDILPMTVECIVSVKNLEVECGLSPWSHVDYKKETSRSDSISFIAKRKNKVVGFAIARVITPNEIELYNIAVAEMFRNFGVGGSLLDHILNDPKAQNVSCVWLELRESNYAAARFYEKKGFVKAYIRNKFYRAPLENAIVMRLDLAIEKA